MAFDNLDMAHLKPRIARLAKFGIVGGSGVVVNVGILALCKEQLGIDYRIASLIAIECAIVNNFIWNFRWTWQERRGAGLGSGIAMFTRFNISSGLTALAVNWGLLVLLTEAFGLHYSISNLIGIAMGTVANFLFSHFWAFKVNRRTTP
jgi:dolichol-phosphate mannosyltransferase